jgi:hypothetical protein
VIAERSRKLERLVREREIVAVVGGGEAAGIRVGAPTHIDAHVSGSQIRQERKADSEPCREARHHDAVLLKALREPSDCHSLRSVRHWAPMVSPSPDRKREKCP